MKRSRRLRDSDKSVDEKTLYSLKEGVKILKQVPPAKFDETVELSFKLGVDSKHADQVVRGSVLLPHGLGKTKKVLVFAKGEEAKKAEEAGADYVGDQDYISQIQKGWTDFDVVVSTPSMMKDIAKLGKILGTKGLMPSPKNGTVTMKVEQAVKELKAGKVSFRVDKANDIHLPIGKISFSEEHIEENAQSIIDAVSKAKPAVCKGKYIRKVALSATMSLGVRIDTTSFI